MASPIQDLDADGVNPADRSGESYGSEFPAGQTFNSPHLVPEVVIARPGVADGRRPPECCRLRRSSRGRPISDRQNRSVLRTPAGRARGGAAPFVPAQEVRLRAAACAEAGGQRPRHAALRDASYPTRCRRRRCGGRPEQRRIPRRHRPTAAPAHAVPWSPPPGSCDTAARYRNPAPPAPGSAPPGPRSGRKRPSPTDPARATAQKVLVPLPCPALRETAGNHGHRGTGRTRTTPDRYTWSGAVQLRWVWDLNPR